MFKVDVTITANIHNHNHVEPDAATIETIKRIETKVDKLIDALVPGPAVRLNIKAGTPVEQP